MVDHAEKARLITQAIEPHPTRFFLCGLGGLPPCRDSPPFSSASQGGEYVSSTSSPVAPERLGKPLFLGGPGVSFEAAAAGVFSCGLLGFIVGMGWGWRQGKVAPPVVRKDSNSQRRLHED